MENEKTITTEENINSLGGKLKQKKKSMKSEEKLPFQKNYYIVLKINQENLIK